MNPDKPIIESTIAGIIGVALHVAGCTFLLCFLCLLCFPASLSATTVTGTIKKPDGTPVTGTIEFTLSQAAKTTTPPVIYAPVKTICAVTNGVIAAGCTVQGNDILDPAGTYYLVRVLDTNNVVVVPAAHYTLSGAAVDLGSLPISATATLVAPTGSVTGNMNVTGNLTVGGSATFNFSTVTAQRLNQIRLVDPTLWTESSVTAKENAAISDCAGANCLVIFPSNLASGQPTTVPDNVNIFDLRRVGSYRYTGYPTFNTGSTKALTLLGVVRETAAASNNWFLWGPHLTAWTGGINNTGGPKIQYAAEWASVSKRTRGQGTGIVAEIGSYAQGDTTALDAAAYEFGGINAGGDEGLVGARIRAWQTDSMTSSAIFTATVTLTSSACGTPCDVGVNYASATNEAYRGENRPLINLSTAVTSPGAISSISGTPPVVTGSGTTFCTSLGVTCPYTPTEKDVFFSMVGDDASTGEKLVVPVRTVTSNTSLTLDYIVQGSDKAWTGTASGAYRLYRGGIVVGLSESGQVTVRQNASGGALFNAGNSIEQPLGYDFALAAGIKSQVGFKLPVAIGGSTAFLASNLGPRAVQAAFKTALQNAGKFDFGINFSEDVNIGGIWFQQASVTHGTPIIWDLSDGTSLRLRAIRTGTSFEIFKTGTGGKTFTFNASTGAVTFPNDLTLRSSADVNQALTLDTGSTAAFVTEIALQDRGANKWNLRKTVGNDFALIDSGIGVNRLYFTTGGNTQLSTGNTGGNINFTDSTGTSRLQLTPSNMVINGGVSNNGGGFKHARVSTGSIAAGSSAAVTLTWTTAFADAIYTVNCSLLEATASTTTLRFHHVESVTAASVVVRIVNDDGAAAHIGTLHCTAVHD